MKSYRYILTGLSCSNCAKKIEDTIRNTAGFTDVIVNFSTLKLSFRTNKDESKAKEEIENIVKSIESNVKVYKENEKIDEKAERNSFDIIRIIVGLSIYLIGMQFNFNEIISNILITISLIILLYKTAKKAAYQIIKNKTLDENALISISAIGACLVDKAMEGIMVIVLYEIGKILEAKAVSKTRKSISELMNIKPEYANLKIDNKIQKVSPEIVSIGDIIVVKSGEKIPLDGVVITGSAEIDNSALTGESKLNEVTEGLKVLSGGINVQGLLEIKVEKDYENSTINQILNLVENATDKKAKTETFIAKAAKIYTPVVLILAIIVAIFMPIFFSGVSYSESIYKALIFLVISCPCSIAISIPLSYFSGIGKASKKGILIKGSDYLDALKDVDEIIFDKTGTITTGKFIVKEIYSINNSYSKNEILKYFTLGENFSNHPIGKSIIAEFKKNNKYIDTSDVEEFEEIAGKGLKYKYKNDYILIGNEGFVEYIDKQSDKENGTTLYLKINKDIVGKIILSDEIKKGAKDTIKKLSLLGIRTKMFTGDRKSIADDIATEVGINQVKSQLLPQNKYEELEKILLNNTSNKKVAFVGDGINDSPVLARADIGISMGGIGSSSAIEASDVVIMTDELEKIIDGIKISKKTNTIIKQNLLFAIGVKLLILFLSLIGITDMWEAVFADVGTTLITIFNTIRILK